MTSQTTLIGFQGEHGAFSEHAVSTLRPDATPVPKRTFEAVVDAVEAGDIHAGVLPVENTLAGGVAAAYDALMRGRVRVIAETVIPIRHCLMGVAGASVATLREARSHPVALAQCAGFFRDRSDIRPVVVHDTAGAAMEVAELKDPTIGAIAAEGAADRYGLVILAKDLQDRPDNQTRFFLVEPTDEAANELAPASRSVPDSAPATVPVPPPFKTSLLAETANRPGALHALLGVFAKQGLDLTYVESRPSGTPWTYRFVIEFRHTTPEEAHQAVAASRPMTRAMRVLGTFRGAESGS